jgi:hypothetical protein
LQSLVIAEVFARKKTRSAARMASNLWAKSLVNSAFESYEYRLLGNLGLCSCCKGVWR